MPLLEGTYVPTSKQQLYDRLEVELQEEFDIDGDLSQLSVLSSLVDAFSETLHDRQEHELEAVYEAAFLDTATGKDLDYVVAILGIERIAASHATGVVQFSRDTTSTHDYVIQKGTVVQTQASVPIQFETTEATIIEDGTTSAKATVRAIEGGDEGNVGANTLTVMPSPPDGVDSVTNPNPTGHPDYTDTSGNDLTVGRDQETDDELRERASVTVTKGGAATVDALLSALINNKDLPNVQSVSLYNNRSTKDNTDTGGLPAKSFEAVVYGGREQQIAEALFDTMSVTSHDYSGAHGTSITKSVTGINGQTWPISFSRPTELTVDITVDLVTTDTYVGDTAIKDAIVEYVGGTDSDGDTIMGAGVGEDIYYSTIEDIVTGIEDTGVRGVTSISSTPTSTTDANGLTIVDVGGAEVASVNATDGSITLNTVSE